MTVGAIPAAPIEKAAIGARNSKHAVEPLRELAGPATAIWHTETGVPLRYAGGNAITPTPSALQRGPSIELHRPLLPRIALGDAGKS